MMGNIIEEYSFKTNTQSHTETETQKHTETQVSEPEVNFVNSFSSGRKSQLVIGNLF